MTSSSRAMRPNHQAFDEVRITTHPRYKESEYSGDEWRISGVIRFYNKGHLLGQSSYRNAETALRWGDWSAVSLFESGQVDTNIEFIDDRCDQEGCSSRWTHLFDLKKRFRDDGSVKEMPWPEYRCFCDKHSRRGNCGLDDADNNYELREKRDIHEPLDPLLQCAQWFQEYADHHLLKGDMDKAKRNQDRANFARLSSEEKKQ